MVVLSLFPPYDVRFLRLCCSVGDDVRFLGDDVRSCIFEVCGLFLEDAKFDEGL